MIETTLQSLRQRLTPLRKRIAAGELLFIDDLFVDVAGLPAGFAAFHVDGRLDPDQRFDDLSPGLSFIWEGDDIVRFATAERLRTAVREFLNDHQMHFVFKIDRSDLLIAAPDRIGAKALATVLSQAIRLLMNGSLNALNKYQDDIEARCNDLRSAFTESGGAFGMLDLVAFVDNLTGADFGLMHLSNRALTVLTTSSSGETLRQLSRFIDLEEDAFPKVEGRRDQPFPVVTLPQSAGAELIGNAAIWGKPLASPTDFGKRILILPITRPLVRREVSDETATTAAADLLFTFVDELDQWFMDVLRACVDTFSSYRYGERRFNLLTELQIIQERERVARRIEPGHASTPFGGVDLNQVLNEVLYTTSAHSVSLRVYDAGTRSLVSIASAVGAFDGSDTQHAPKSIPIKGYESTSVVVFTFLRGTREMPYVYLKRISHPITHIHNGRIKTRHRTFIPRKYKDEGLQVPLLTRSLTRSEICFALRQGELTFGTLNIEAPYPGAFDQDINYLLLIKSALERSYGFAGQQIDGQWLIANAARSDSVHQLWQFQEQGNFFDKEQNQVLRAIFPPRSEHALTGSRKLSDLCKRVLSWVKTRYDGTLEHSVVKMLKFDHVSDSPVSALFAEAAYVIARNVIQNAVKHGEPETDLIFFDDRAWFGARVTPCLRIHYRSSSQISSELLDVLGTAPVLHDDSDRVGYGMYNVGLLTRLLGGSLYVSRDDATARLTIDIHLPISETN